ncbi:hypothetical protein PR048_033713 [Dryococelus australis]|uniref:Zinc finger MYM-type protein 1-like n=1 Tax=Dryococelus australis TaxID=614101 RepID=A0ABQ9G567_9NEOP|nr:hypothetical protein PR048_033713 [Dryococelus australis]
MEKFMTRKHKTEELDSDHNVENKKKPDTMEEDGTIESTCTKYLLSCTLSPNQPAILPDSFHEQVLKGRTLKFLPAWYKSFNWLHVEPGNPGTLCFYFIHFSKSNQQEFLAKKIEDVFSFTGFSNWKKAREKLCSHENSESHNLSVLNYKQKDNFIEKQMLSETSTEQMKARIFLEKIITSIGFLTKQEIAFRSHDSNSENWFELINLYCEYSLELKQWMARNKESYLDSKIQNKILGLLSNEIVYEICTKICSQNTPIFSIICDGTRDISGEEQPIYVSDGSTKIYVLVKVLLVCTPLALYVHCRAHCVNLVILAACNSSITAKIGSNVVTVITCQKQFRPSFRAANTAKMKPLCPMRWIYTGNPINEIIEHYEEILAILKY